MPTLYESFITGDNGESFIQADTQYWAQTFTPSTSHTITSVKLKLLKRNVPGTITVGIRATDGAGKPTGANLTSGTLDATTLDTTPGSFKEIAFGAGTDLTSGIKYAIVLSCAGNNPGTPDDIAWRVKSTGGYAGGDKRFSSNSGVTWGDALSGDFMFEEWGNVTGGATISTQEGTDVTAISATGHGLYSAAGDSSVTQHGHVWSTSPNPTTADSKTENGASPNLGQFSSNITDLTPGTLYYVAAYAINTQGTVYGSDVTINTGTTIQRAHIWSEGKEFHYFDEYGVERVLQGHGVASDKDILPWLAPWS